MKQTSGVIFFTAYIFGSFLFATDIFLQDDSNVFISEENQQILTNENDQIKTLISFNYLELAISQANLIEDEVDREAISISLQTFKMNLKELYQATNYEKFKETVEGFNVNLPEILSECCDRTETLKILFRIDQMTKYLNCEKRKFI